MKKIILFFLSAASLMMLISCTNHKETSHVNSSEIYNNWYDVRMSDSAIYNGNGNASIIEYETMKTSILCNIPNCSHSTSECVVNILNNSDQLPIIYDNCAYYFLNFNSFAEEDGKNKLDLKTQIKKYDFNNRTITDIAEINEFNANDSGGCYLIGSDYYFTAYNGNPQYDEAGNAVSSKGGGGGNLFSVNLESGKAINYGEIFDYQKLKEDYPASVNSTSIYLMGKMDNKLYIRISYTKEEITHEMMENGTEPDWNGFTYTFDLNTHEFEKINDEFSICAMNGYLTYLGENNKLMIQDIKTNEIYEGPEIISYNAVSIFDDKIWYDSKCFDIKSGTEETVSSLEFAFAIGEYKDCYIIRGESDTGACEFEKISKNTVEGE